MATAKEKESTKAADSAASANGASAGGLPAPDMAPSGFRRRVSISDAPWVSQEANNVVYGRLLNRYEMQGQTPRRWYYQIELHAPCKVRIGKGEDAEIATAQKGDVVNLNENHKLTSLRDVEIPEIIAGAAYDIWAKYENKIKISGGRTMWNVDVQTKQLKAPTSPVRALAAGDLGEASDDTPF